VPKRGAIALVTTALAVVLLFTFKPADQVSGLPGVPNLGAGNPVGIPTPRPVAGGQPRPTARPAATSAGGTTASAAPGATAPHDPPAPTDAPAPGGGATGTYTGDAIDTPYGTVQIAIVVQGGRITGQLNGADATEEKVLALAMAEHLTTVEPPPPPPDEVEP